MGKERIHQQCLQFCRTESWEKSALYGVIVGEEDLQSKVEKLNYKVTSFPFIYLGLPLGGYPRQVASWQSVLDKIHKKLD